MAPTAPHRCWFVLILLMHGLALAVSFPMCEVTPAAGWDIGTFGAAQLSGLAGSDFTSTQTTASDFLNINTYLLLRADTYEWDWRLDVNRTDTLWDSNMTLWIMRTTDGTGSGTITGGTAFQSITTTAQSFYSGTRNRRNVKAQLELRGLSVIVGPNNYSTTVTYTLVEL